MSVLYLQGHGKMQKKTQETGGALFLLELQL